MFKVICVTQAELAKDFFGQLEKICVSGADRIILREKHLSCEEYKALAQKVIPICRRHGTPLSLHSFTDTAIQLGCDSIHLSYEDLISGKGKGFRTVGASVHSAEEAVTAEKMGAFYLIAGHIFPTECKKNLPPRGTDFLREICYNVSIPVFAIGGINAENVHLIRQSGASGACIMSGLMKADDPNEFISEIRRSGVK